MDVKQLSTNFHSHCFPPRYSQTTLRWRCFDLAHRPKIQALVYNILPPTTAIHSATLILPPLSKPPSRRTCLIIISKLFFTALPISSFDAVCVCVVSVIVKRPVLPPCVVDGRSRNPLYYYYYTRVYVCYALQSERGSCITNLAPMKIAPCIRHTSTT